MGLANECMFAEIRIFKFISIDLKGPYVLPPNKTFHVLVLVCLQTKYTETVLLESRTAETILEAFNVVFTQYAPPVRITADQESGVVKLAANIHHINSSLLAEYEVSIELIPAKSHHMSGLVERRIRQIATILGRLDMTADNMTETKFCNTLRIITSYLNSIPYLVQFIGGQEKTAASGINEYPMEVQYVSPISWLYNYITNYQTIKPA